MLELSLIRIDGGTQIRAELNQETVDAYAEAYLAGAVFPAITVFFDGKDRWLADGFHRYFAAKKAGKTTILEKITPGTKRDAILFSLGANGTHGLNRTNADKRNAITTMLQDSEWSAWSDNAIAKACHVSDKTVAAHRASLRNSEVTTPTERTYTTKHGTTATMQTASIGKPSAPAAKPAPVVEPIAEEPEDYTELDALKDSLSAVIEQNDCLNDRLAVAALDATEEERNAAHATILALRAENKTLTATNRALKLSCDSLMEEAVQMKRQMAMQRKEIDKLKNNK